MSPHTASQLVGSSTLQPGNSLSQYKQPGGKDHSEQPPVRLPGYAWTSCGRGDAPSTAVGVSCVRHSQTGVASTKCTHAAPTGSRAPMGPNVCSSDPPKQSASFLQTDRRPGADACCAPS